MPRPRSSCDSCRSLRVRCGGPMQQGSSACLRCSEAGISCNWSFVSNPPKRARQQETPPVVPAPAAAPARARPAAIRPTPPADVRRGGPAPSPRKVRMVGHAAAPVSELLPPLPDLAAVSEADALLYVHASFLPASELAGAHALATAAVPATVEALAARAVLCFSRALAALSACDTTVAPAVVELMNRGGGFLGCVSSSADAAVPLVSSAVLLCLWTHLVVGLRSGLPHECVAVASARLAKLNTEDGEVVAALRALAMRDYASVGDLRALGFGSARLRGARLVASLSLLVADPAAPPPSAEVAATLLEHLQSRDLPPPHAEGAAEAVWRAAALGALHLARRDMPAALAATEETLRLVSAHPRVLLSGIVPQMVAALLRGWTGLPALSRPTDMLRGIQDFVRQMSPVIESVSRQAGTTRSEDLALVTSVLLSPTVSIAASLAASRAASCTTSRVPSPLPFGDGPESAGDGNGFDSFLPSIGSVGTGSPFTASPFGGSLGSAGLIAGADEASFLFDEELLDLLELSAEDAPLC